MLDRRRLLGAVLAGAGSGFSAKAAAPANGSGKTFLLVHGAWHGAQHWNLVVEHLTGRGHRVLAIDLPGHGLKARLPDSYVRQDLAAFAAERSPVADITLDDYVAATMEALRNLAADRKVTLVGHSMSGAVITRVGEMAPQLIERLVYLSAYCPLQLPNALAYNTLPEHGAASAADILVGDPKAIGSYAGKLVTAWNKWGGVSWR